MEMLLGEAKRCLLRCGLQGMTRKQLWMHLAAHLGSEELCDTLQRVVWQYIAKNGVLLYQITAQYPGEEEWKHRGVHIQSDGVLFGETATERSEVTMEQSQDVDDDFLVMVAGSRQRRKYLGIDTETIMSILSPQAYAVLEVCGRYAETGVQKLEVGSILNIKPKDLFYYLKVVDSFGLVVRTHDFIIPAEDAKKALSKYGLQPLLYLRRFVPCTFARVYSHRVSSFISSTETEESSVSYRDTTAALLRLLEIADHHTMTEQDVCAWFEEQFPDQSWFTARYWLFNTGRVEWKHQKSDESFVQAITIYSGADPGRNLDRVVPSSYDAEERSGRFTDARKTDWGRSKRASLFQMVEAAQEAGLASSELLRETGMRTKELARELKRIIKPALRGGIEVKVHRDGKHSYKRYISPRYRATAYQRNGLDHSESSSKRRLYWIMSILKEQPFISFRALLGTLQFRERGFKHLMDKRSLVSLLQQLCSEGKLQIFNLDAGTGTIDMTSVIILYNMHLTSYEMECEAKRVLVQEHDFPVVRYNNTVRSQNDAEDTLSHQEAHQNCYLNGLLSFKPLRMFLIQAHILSRFRGTDVHQTIGFDEFILTMPLSIYVHAIGYEDAFPAPQSSTLIKELPSSIRESILRNVTQPTQQGFTSAAASHLKDVLMRLHYMGAIRLHMVESECFQWNIAVCCTPQNQTLGDLARFYTMLYQHARVFFDQGLQHDSVLESLSEQSFPLETKFWVLVQASRKEEEYLVHHLHEPRSTLSMEHMQALISGHKIHLRFALHLYHYLHSSMYREVIQAFKPMRRSKRAAPEQGIHVSRRHHAGVKLNRRYYGLMKESLFGEFIGEADDQVSQVAVSRKRKQLEKRAESQTNQMEEEPSPWDNVASFTEAVKAYAMQMRLRQECRFEMIQFPRLHMMIKLVRMLLFHPDESYDPKRGYDVLREFSDRELLAAFSILRKAKLCRRHQAAPLSGSRRLLVTRSAFEPMQHTELPEDFYENRQDEMNTMQKSLQFHEMQSVTINLDEREVTSSWLHLVFQEQVKLEGTFDDETPQLGVFESGFEQELRQCFVKPDLSSFQFPDTNLASEAQHLLNQISATGEDGMDMDALRQGTMCFIDDHEFSSYLTQLESLQLILCIPLYHSKVLFDVSHVPMMYFQSPSYGAVVHTPWRLLTGDLNTRMVSQTLHKIKCCILSKPGINLATINDELPFLTPAEVAIFLHVLVLDHDILAQHVYCTHPSPFSDTLGTTETIYVPSPRL